MMMENCTSEMAVPGRCGATDSLILQPGRSPTKVLPYTRGAIQPGGSFESEGTFPSTPTNASPATDGAKPGAGSRYWRNQGRGRSGERGRENNFQRTNGHGGRQPRERRTGSGTTGHRCGAWPPPRTGPSVDGSSGARLAGWTGWKNFKRGGISLLEQLSAGAETSRGVWSARSNGKRCQCGSRRGWKVGQRGQIP